MSSLDSAILINVVVITITLLTDLGLKAVTYRRLLRPFVTTLIIVPFFVSTFFTSGVGLAVEIAGVAAGVLVGLLAVSLFRMERNPEGQVCTRAGAGYAALWIAIGLGRTLFSVGATYWFTTAMAKWFIRQGAAPRDISDMVTNALVFMAVTMLLTRSVGLRLRSQAMTHQLRSAAFGRQLSR